MGVLLHLERVADDREVLDLTVHDARETTGPTSADEPTALDRGDRMATVLAFMVVGALAIVAILGLWAAFPADGGL